MDNKKESGILVKTNISDQIFDILKKKIIDGEYKEGEKLPGEIELGEIYAVSRMTARTALQKLSAFGIVEIKSGEGTFVKKFNTKSYFADAIDLISSENTTKSINEFRKYFEPFCIMLACKNRTEGDIDRLEIRYKKMLEAAESDNIWDFFDADYEFHLFVCEIGKNSVVKIICELLMELIKKHYVENMKKYAVINGFSFNKQDKNYAIRQSAILHREIVDDIIKGDNTVSANRWNMLTNEYDKTTLPDDDQMIP